MEKNTIAPILQALLAALLFGVSAPISKLFLDEIEPIPLAAFLYLGSGMGLFLFQALQKRGLETKKEASIKLADIKWLAGAIIAGGIVAPILLLFGLRNTPGATASLLLNFEGVATTLIATFAFKEAVSHRAWWAILAITIASILLSLSPGDEWGFSWGAAGVLAACVFWGIDNNFTRNISSKNPVSIVMMKGFIAGSFSLLLAVIIGSQIPNVGVILQAMLLGSLSYGLSLTLFIKAMRGLGAARTSALYSTAPLVGIAASFLLLQESANLLFWSAAPLMLVGAFLLVNEEHDHHHIHETYIHDHTHHHNDGHHVHQHSALLENQAHTHEHNHENIKHSHHHMPDIHHRHTHAADDETE